MQSRRALEHYREHDRRGAILGSIALTNCRRLDELDSNDPLRRNLWVGSTPWLWLVEDRCSASLGQPRADNASGLQPEAPKSGTRLTQTEKGPQLTGLSGVHNRAHQASPVGLRGSLRYRRAGCRREDDAPRRSGGRPRGTQPIRGHDGEEEQPPRIHSPTLHSRLAFVPSVSRLADIERPASPGPRRRTKLGNRRAAPAHVARWIRTFPSGSGALSRAGLRQRTPAGWRSASASALFTALRRRSRTFTHVADRENQLAAALGRPVSRRTPALTASTHAASSVVRVIDGPVFRRRDHTGVARNMPRCAAYGLLLWQRLPLPPGTSPNGV